MRASPAFRVSIRRQGQWRAAVAALLGAALAVQAAWLLARWHDGTPAAALGALAAGDVALLVLAARALRQPALSLHWDGRQWHLAAADAPAAPAVPGRLAVALDLGAWLLLRFDPDAGRAGARRTWVPVQRRGLEAEWHALRCAVYCERPSTGAVAGSRAGTESQE